MAVAVLLIVLAVGLGAGYVASRVGRRGTDQKRAGYLGMGLVGAVVGDWLLTDALGIFPEVSLLGHILAALAGAAAFLLLAGVFRTVFSR
jgi:uncharacterized membrane protein YeaQ/YmgE (transglycosylase-associated protein family)